MLTDTSKVPCSGQTRWSHHPGKRHTILKRCYPDPESSFDCFELSKTFHGDLQGTGAGVMLSGGDPQAGAAGYVAIETVDGSLGGRQGSFALQQFGSLHCGSLHCGSQTLHYEVVPGSGSGQLDGLTGILHLNIDEDGTHRYELEYEL